MSSKRTKPGIEVRHSRSCPGGKGCKPKVCTPSYRAEIYDRRTKRKVRKAFPSFQAASDWRIETLNQLRLGSGAPQSRLTLNQYAAAWLEAAKAGVIRTRSGERYKPSALRGYEQALNDRLLPLLGNEKLTDIPRKRIQLLVGQLQAEGLSASTIRNTLLPLRAIYRHAIDQEEVALNPTERIRLPRVDSRRERVASPDEAAELLAALPQDDRALWATAMYAGLRLGELRALLWEDVDLAAGVIRVEWGWDQKEGRIETKSKAGRRRAPIAAILRDYLDEHKLGSWPEGLAFGRSPERPFNPSSVWGRAQTAWKRANAKRAEAGLEPLEPITPHEARHTFASMLIAAGVNAKAISTYMGHSSISITYDLYGHLMPGNEDEAAALLDSYLARADTKARIASLERVGT